MGTMFEHRFAAVQPDITAETLADQIAYYKAMLAETSRMPHSSRTCLTPQMLQERLGECERLLAQLASPELSLLNNTASNSQP